MADFRLYSNNAPSKKNYPYLLNVQTRLLDDLESRVVIPLLPLESLANRGIKYLNPEMKVQGETYFVMTQQISAVPSSSLGELIEGVEIDRSSVLAAIDFLVTGI